MFDKEMELCEVILDLVYELGDMVEPLFSPNEDFYCINEYVEQLANNVRGIRNLLETAAED